MTPKQEIEQLNTQADLLRELTIEIISDEDNAYWDALGEEIYGGAAWIQ